MNTRTNRMNAPDAYARMAATEKVQFKIGGMACSFCVASITKALGRMDGVRDVNVNLAHEETLIEYEPIKVAPARLRETLLDLGYTVRDAKKVRSFEEYRFDRSRTLFLAVTENLVHFDNTADVGFHVGFSQDFL